MKTALAILLLLAGLAAIAMGVVSAPASAQPKRVVPQVVMRALPGSPAAMVAKTEVAAVIPAEKPKAAEDDLAALKPADAKPAVAKPADVKPAEPKPAEAKPAVAEARPVEKPAEARPAEVKPPPVVQPKPAGIEARPAEPKPAPAPVAAKPPPAAKPAPADGVVPATGGAAAAAPVVGQFNLRASDTADVFVDGKKVGGSPVLGHKVKPGKHKVRFDCYDASGEARPGVSQTYEVAADGEKDVEYDCPTE